MPLSGTRLNNETNLRLCVLELAISVSGEKMSHNIAFSSLKVHRKHSLLYPMRQTPYLQETP